MSGVKIKLFNFKGGFMLTDPSSSFVPSHHYFHCVECLKIHSEILVQIEKWLIGLLASSVVTSNRSTTCSTVFVYGVLEQ